MSGWPPLNYLSFHPGSNPDSCPTSNSQRQPCTVGLGRGEDGSLKMRISQEEHERGRSRCFERTVTVVTTEVPAALTEVTRANAAVPSERGIPPPSPGTTATTIIRSLRRGIKCVAGGKAARAEIKGWWPLVWRWRVRQAWPAGPGTAVPWWDRLGLGCSRNLPSCLTISFSRGLSPRCVSSVESRAFSLQCCWVLCGQVEGGDRDGRHARGSGWHSLIGSFPPGNHTDADRCSTLAHWPDRNSEGAFSAVAQTS